MRHDLSSRVDEVLDFWLAAHERLNAVFERAIRLRQARVLPQVLPPRADHKCLDVSIRYSVS